MSATQSTLSVAEAKARLCELFPKGSTVYLIRRSTSRTGDTYVAGVCGLFTSASTGRVMVRQPNVAASLVLECSLVAGSCQIDGIRWSPRKMYSGVANATISQALGDELYGDINALKEEWL